MTRGVIRSLLTQAREHLGRIGIDVDSWPGDAEFAEQALAALDSALESLAARDTQIREALQERVAEHDQGEYFNGDHYCCNECDSLTRQSDFVPFSPCTERKWAETLLALLESGDAPHEEAT